MRRRRSDFHSIPSLNNLYIHITTQDFYSTRLKYKKHYNSFLPRVFLKPQAGLVRSGYGPVVPETKIYIGPSRNGFSEATSKSPLKCTYCGAISANRFVHSRKHLSEEFVEQFVVNITN